MIILAFLQNQWFKDPDRIKAIYERNPELRNELIKRFLFMGCLSGRRLTKAFGEDLCQQIIWEEVSPEIGGYASSCFPADIAHIEAAIEKHQPTVIVALGKIAGDAINAISNTDRHKSVSTILYGPHPAARTDPMPRLEEIGFQLYRRIQESKC